MVNRTDRMRIGVVVFSFVAVSGALIQIRGTLLSSFQETFTVSPGELGLLTPVATIGFTLAILLIGPASGRIDVRRFMAGSIALTGVAVVAFAFAPFYGVLLVIEGIRSFVTGVFRALDRPLMGHLYPDSRGRILSLLGMGWALGAAAGPLLVIALVNVGGLGWQAVYLVVAVGCLPLAVLALRSDFSVFDRNERTLTVASLRAVLREPGIHTMAVSLTLVGGIESGFFTWLPYYLSQSLSPSIANLSLTVFLVSYIPGRLAFSRLTERYHNLDLLVVATVALAFGLWLAMTVLEGIALLGAMFVIGLLMSGMFPTLITIGMETTPAFSGPVNAIGNVAARVGFLTVPALIGILAELYTIETAMTVQVLLGGALAVSTSGFKLLTLR